ALIEREIHKPFRTPASDGILLVVGTRSVSDFVILSHALVDLDYRFDIGIVIPPVGAHVGRTRVRRYDSVVLFEVRVEVLGVGCVASRIYIDFGESWKRAHSALGE